MKKIKKYLLNGTYFTIIILITSILVSLSLTRKMNHYSTTNSLFDFIVQKDEVEISNSIEGQIIKLYVHEGQEVKKGDLIAVLSNPLVEDRIKVLTQIDGNLSASTESQLLLSQKDAYQIRSTRDGVIYKIHNVEGSYLTTNAPVVTLHANDKIVLQTSVTDAQLDEMQKIKSLSVYNPRLEQSFDIEYQGVGVAESNKENFNLYVVTYGFSNKEEGSLFFHGESLKVLGITNESKKTPVYAIVNFWNRILN